MIELWFSTLDEGPYCQTQDGLVGYFTTAEAAQIVKEKIAPIFPELVFNLHDSNGPLIDPSAEKAAESLGRKI